MTLANTADFQRVLGGLCPRRHLRHDLPRTVYPQRCARCIADDMARQPTAAALRPFTDGWGTLDLDLAMPELAMQIAAGNFPEFLAR